MLEFVFTYCLVYINFDQPQPGSLFQRKEAEKRDPGNEVDFEASQSFIGFSCILIANEMAINNDKLAPETELGSVIFLLSLPLQISPIRVIY